MFYDLIGETTIGQILELQGTKHAIINKQKSYKSKKPHSGLFIINNFEIITPKTFLQYIQQDQVRLNFSCAIDFTGSNGDPRYANSLHYKSSQRRSQYTDALAPICLIVQDYDSDKIVPAYGFGAKLPNGTVSHHFPLNINTGEAEMFSLEQILENYWNCVERVTLWGPTNFAPTIRTAVSQSLNSNGKDYSVLLILTDGAITDMSETIKEIEKAQHAPISIIIVGVGTADFSSMELLDGDSGDSKFSKVRDCVQFCSYKEVENHFPQGSLMTPDGFQQMKAMLAARVLEELPKQLEEYFKMKGL